LTVRGKKFQASCPSGTSVGKYEQPVLKVSEAVKQIERLGQLISQREFASQAEFDAFLREKSAFANVTLPLSIAFCRAFDTLPRSRAKSLPRLLLLAFEGGLHSNSSLKIQEFLVLAKSVPEGRDLYQRLKRGLEKKGIDTDTGLEGGFAPNNLTDERTLELLRELLPRGTRFGLDLGGRYYKGKPETVEKLIERFSIALIEDPFAEDDLVHWQRFYRQFGRKLLVVGDDLVTTNLKRLRKCLRPKVINAVIVKPNQIGTVSATLAFVRAARKNGLKIIVSHRSGETLDTFIADLAVAIKADFVKFGGFTRGERIARYNRLLELSR